ncbi:MAG: HAMP domain-containing sensor histidine kinase [Pseudomonadota bacterium]
MHTLFARLGLALLAIVTLTGGAIYLLEQYSTRNYHEEITQRLNASIAMYVTDERQLMRNGEVDQEALAQLSQQAMVINPTVEIYLLDTTGTIIGSAVPDESLQTERVDLEPVTELLAGNVPMPLRGTDPRSAREKVFSAHPVMFEENIEGYLYAVLGGQTYDQLADSIRGSYVRQVSLGAMLAILAAAFFVGLLVFGLLTRRLERLTSDVRQFTESGFEPERALVPGNATGRDEISQLREACGRMSEKILQQFDDLKETDRLRRELISNVSHDLRTPLSSMHGFVETLLIKNHELDAEERRHYLEITRKHTQRLGQLIGDLFELSKLESASIKPNLEPFSLAELLHDVAQEFELEARDRGIQLDIETAGDQALVVADIGLVQRVLENLLRNALKYTPRGGDVRLTLESVEAAVSVAVADSGCGIAEEDLEHIFDRFYRAAPARDDGESAGLGLAIVRKILDLHGSRITVRSKPQEGTRFEFTLPARAVA